MQLTTENAQSRKRSLGIEACFMSIESVSREMTHWARVPGNRR
jgi:hypothetical protein